jgi:hypothetical protein
MIALSRVVFASLAAASSVASTAALAQTNTPSAPLTRAQVRADLADWLQAGFDPMDKLDYPANALRAGAIVAQRRAERAAAGQTQRP